MNSRVASGYAVPSYGSLISALVVIVSLPVYFSDDRAVAFNISPRNGYSPDLLARKGETGDGRNRQAELLPGAPMAHRLRLVAVAVALPFYYVLPHYAFTNIEAPDEPYLRATAALAFPGGIFMLVIYATARRRYACTGGHR